MKNKVMTLVMAVSLLFVPFAHGQMTIELTGLTHGQHLSPCTDILLSSNIDVQSGEIKRVYYYRESMQIRSVTKVPYEYTWENVPAGIYHLSAKVADKDGNEFFSDTLIVFVGELQNGEQIENGEFECSQFPWQLKTSNGGQGTFTLEESWLSTGNMAVVEVESPGVDVWDVMIMQPCRLVQGHKYMISFMAEVEEATDMLLSIQETGGSWQAHIYETVALEGGDIYGPFELIPEVDVPRAELRLMVGGNKTGAFFFDAVSVIDSNLVDLHQTTDVPESQGEFVRSFNLKPNYPNPFNPNTTLEYNVQKSGAVFLGVYNVLGKLVQVLVDERQPQGHHVIEWNGRDSRGNQVESGTYFVKLYSDGRISTQKMTLVK